MGVDAAGSVRAFKESIQGAHEQSKSLPMGELGGGMLVSRA